MTLNRIYRLVWNRALAALQVTSELSAARGGGSTTRDARQRCPASMRRAVIALCVAAAFGPAGIVCADAVTVPSSASPALSVAATPENDGTIRGGNGADGAFGQDGVDGGTGIELTGSLVNSGSILGGNGGNGGAGDASTRSGNGGNGGVAMLGSGFQLINTGVVTGGAAGSAGGSGLPPGKAGVSGTGIVSMGNAWIENRAVIQGGMPATGSPGRAIELSGGGNTVSMTSTAVFHGEVFSNGAVAGGTGDTLALGGDTDGTFDVGLIGDVSAQGKQFVGFASLEKTGASAWTLTGQGNATQNWTLSQGGLVVDTHSLVGALYASAGTTLTFNQAFDGTYAGVVNGYVNLVKQGTGSLTLQGDSVSSRYPNIGSTRLEEGALILRSVDLRGAMGDASSGGRGATGVTALTGTSLTSQGMWIVGGWGQWGATGGAGGTAVTGEGYTLVAIAQINGGNGGWSDASSSAPVGVAGNGGNAVIGATSVDNRGWIAGGRGGDAGTATGSAQGNIGGNGGTAYTGGFSIIENGAQGTIEGGAGGSGSYVDGHASQVNRGGNGGNGIVIHDGYIHNATGGIIRGGMYGLGGRGLGGSEIIDNDGGAGAGIVATGNTTVVNEGRIDGSLTFEAGSRSTAAILFSGGGNVLSLLGIGFSGVTAAVVSTSGTTNGGDTLAVDMQNWAGSNTLYLDHFIGFSHYVVGGSTTLHVTGTAQPQRADWRIGTGGVTMDASLLNGSVAFTGNGGTLSLTHAGDLARSTDSSGAGSLHVAGTGTLTVNGSLLHTGGTWIDSGALRVSGGNIAGPVHDNGQFIVDTATTALLAGTLDGTGSLLKQGAGELVLTDAATHTGGTVIQAGRLRIGHGGIGGSIQGAVHNAGTLVFDRADNVTFNGTVDGTGTVEKTGAGTLVLNNGLGTTGLTTVHQGTLLVGDASHAAARVAGDVTVIGGALGGAGRVDGTVTIGIGGALLPGLGMGALVIACDLSLQSGSMLTYTQASSGALEAPAHLGLSVAGKAQLQGGVAMDLSSGAYRMGGPDYVLLHAGQGIDGRFDNVTLSPGYANYVNAVVAYAPNSVSIGFAPTAAAFNDKAPGYANTVSSALDSTFQTILGDIDTDPRELREDARNGVWAQGIQSEGSLGDDDQSIHGGAVGGGMAVGESSVLGVAVAGLNTETTSQPQRVKAKPLGAFGYGVFSAGAWRFAASFGGGHLKQTTTRRLSDVGLSTSADSTGRFYGAAARLDYRWQPGRFSVSPFLQASYLHSQYDTAGEQGAGMLDLAYGKLTQQLTRYEGGVRMAASFGDETSVVPWIQVGAVGWTGDRRAGLDETIGGITRRIEGNALPSSATAASAGVNLVRGGWRFGLAYRGSFGKDYRAHGGTATAEYHW